RFIETRLKFPGHLSGAAALILVVLIFAGSIWIMIDGAAGFFNQASGVTTRIGPRLDQIIADVAGLFGVEATPTARELVGSVDIRGYLAQAAVQVQGVASGAFFVLVYLGFLIASQVGFRRKIVGMFPERTMR